MESDWVLNLESVRLMIADYKEDFVLPDLTVVNRERFEEFSTIRWACNELWNYISRCGKDDSKSLSSVVADFRHKIYLCKSASKKTEKMFTIALDVVDDIEDILCDIEVDKALYYFKKENDYGFI